VRATGFAGKSVSEKPAFPFPVPGGKRSPDSGRDPCETVFMSQATAPELPADRPLLGIGLMLCFCVIVPFADALAKILGSDFPLMQLILVRFAAQAILLIPLALWLGASVLPQPAHPAADRHARGCR
jgi:hypothetical protein